MIHKKIDINISQQQIIAGDFNTPLSITEHSDRRSIKRTTDLNNTTD